MSTKKPAAKPAAPKKQEQDDNRVVTPTGRIVFIKSLFKPEQNDAGKDKYRATLLLDSKQDIKKIQALIMQTARDEFSEKEIQRKELSYALKRPDAKAMANYDFFTKDTWILEASSGYPVEVKSTKKNHKDQYEDLIEGDLKAGDYCRFLISAYGYDATAKKGKKGVGLNLMAVQFIKEGEALYARTESSSYFEASEFDLEPEEAGAGDDDNFDFEGGGEDDAGDDSYGDIPDPDDGDDDDAAWG